MEILDLYDNKKRKINRTIIRDKENTQKGEYKLSGVCQVKCVIFFENLKFIVKSLAKSMCTKGAQKGQPFSCGLIT